MQFAYFITAHGFGHAARACAVMTALRTKLPTVEFMLFTQTPLWFFENSLDFPITYHSTFTDVGLVQPAPLVEDLPATVQRLQELLPFDPARVAQLAEQVRDCAVILCDIAPLGLAVARAAHLPSVLIENFTWDWIYEGYVAEEPALAPFIGYLRDLLPLATAHIRATPACGGPIHDLHSSAELITTPISRGPRHTPEVIRAQLRIPPEGRILFLTMGGIRGQYGFINQLTALREVYVVIPGGSDTYEDRGNVRLLPHHSRFYHPDLLHAADLVIGKAGYSTLAETYQAGLPFGFVQRPRFRESAVLVDFVQHHIPSLEIPSEQFDDGSWLAHLPALLALPKTQRSTPNGADQAAAFIIEMLS